MYCVYATEQGVDLTGEVQLGTRQEMEQAVVRMMCLARHEAQLTGMPLSQYTVDVDWHGLDCRTDYGVERGLDSGCETIETRSVA